MTKVPDSSKAHGDRPAFDFEAMFERAYDEAAFWADVSLTRREYASLVAPYVREMAASGLVGEVPIQRKAGIAAYIQNRLAALSEG